MFDWYIRSTVISTAVHAAPHRASHEKYPIDTLPLAWFKDFIVVTTW